MKKALYIIIVIVISMASSCTKKGIIPKDTLSDIYYDLYLADQQILGKGDSDSLLIYEPIFNKYGFTTEDYLRTSDYYLKKPDKFAKIFKVTQTKLKKRKELLDRLIAAEDGKNFRWTLLDSLSMLGNSEKNGNAYYRTLNLIFFEPDTIPVTSPTIDSSIINNVENIFFLYDSLTIFDGDITVLLPPVEEEESKVKKDFKQRIQKSKETQKSSGAKTKTIKKLKSTDE